MAKLARFGVSIDKNLLDDFDMLIYKQKYPTRSKAIEDLISDALNSSMDNIDSDVQSTGYIHIMYDHHKRQLLNKITDIQHKFYKTILSSQHIHLNHSICMEIIVVKGIKKEIDSLCGMLKTTKGIKSCKSQIFASSASLGK